MRFTILFVAALASLPMHVDAQLRQAPAPRTRPQTAVDPLTAAISGRVTTAGTGAPLRGAEVRAMSDGGVNRLAASDADGRFELRDLPAGTFRLAVSKSGFVSAQFGQRRPTDAAATIDLAQGERFTANVALLRGGVIAGRVFDRFGEPIAGVRVQAMRSRMAEGRRRLQPVGADDETDDTGSFRVYGLAPGDYYVVARPARAANATPGRDSTPVYYPGTADFTEAQRITVTTAAEANAVMQIVAVRTATVSGVVLDASGAPVEATVNLTSQAIGLGYVNAALGDVPFMIGGRADAEGMFTVTRVPPGPYQLTASSFAVSGTGGRSRNPSEVAHKMASVPVVVSSGDVGGLTLTLSAGGTISGSFVRDPGASRPLPEGVGVSVSGGGMSMGNTGRNGAFRLTGVAGNVRISVEGLPEGWTVKSIVADDVDVTDSPIHMEGRDILVRITLTDRLTELRGTVSSRTPAGDQTVVVFAEDAARWTYPSRFVRSERADDRGAFRITGLPPGDYLAAAVGFLEDGDTQDPEILERLRSRAARFALAEGERRTIELQSVER